MASSPVRTWSLITFYLTLTCLGIYGMRVMPVTQLGIDKYMDNVVITGKFPNGVPLRNRYTGISAVDAGLTYFMVAFLDGSSGWDKDFKFQQSYFLISFYGILSIYEVEASRSRSGLALGRLFVMEWQSWMKRLTMAACFCGRSVINQSAALLSFPHIMLSILGSQHPEQSTLLCLGQCHSRSPNRYFRLWSSAICYQQSYSSGPGKI